MHHGVTLNFGSAQKCSPAIFETSFSYDKDIWIAANDYYVHFYIIVLFSIDIYSPMNKFLQFTDYCCYLAIELSCFDTLSLHFLLDVMFST